jgi:hypothetical protein
MVCFFATHLFANGDLLVVLQGMENSTNGYGLVKLDRDSNVLWKLADNIHHHVDVGPDGTIYTLKHEILWEPPRGLEQLPVPCLADSIVILSAEGEPLCQPIPLLEAFRDSPYAPLVCSLEARPRRVAESTSIREQYEEEVRRRDALHTNSVRVLTPQLAPKFPLFKAGQLLISMRHLDTIAVIDPDKRSAVWAVRGPWIAQHDAQFLDNGRLLLFDNLGSSRTSRVLEFDPLTQAFPWSYPGTAGIPFRSYERGMSQRLPNGNTLIVNSGGREILEVSPDSEVVWSFTDPRLTSGVLVSGRRYTAEQLPFLKGKFRPRP